MTTEQIELLNQANLELVKPQPDLKAAEALMENALARGERFDLLLLTQGRILQKQDRCEEAKQLFGEINVAPHEPSQQIEDIKRIKNKYIEQMETLCSAQLTLTCADQTTALQLGTQQVQCGEEVKLTPGVYQLIATLGEHTDSYDIELGGAEQRSYRVGLVRVDAPTTQEVTQAPTTSPTPSPEVGSENEVSGTVEPPPKGRYRKTAISAVTTLALTGASTLTWYVSKERADRALEPYLTEDGSWKPETTEREKANATSEADQLNRVELVSGYGIPIVAGVGVLTTTIFWIVEARQARTHSNVSWHLDLGHRRAQTGVRIVW